MASPISLACAAGMAPGEQVPEMKIPGRGLDREARLGGDVAALVLVGIAIDDEAKDPSRVLERCRA